ncbi:MAG: response regulator, partial [Spirochaeta sp.]
SHKFSRVVGLDPESGTSRLLVVDDREDNRTLLRDLLEPVGFVVFEAAGGEEAIHLFSQLQPDAVLMDIRMPGTNGYEATQGIRKLPGGDKVPVIALTASSFEDEEAAVHAAGFDGYIRKPFRLEVLFSALQKAMGVRYVYSDNMGQGLERTPQQLEPDDLQNITPEFLQSMRSALERGSMYELKKLIEELSKRYPELAMSLLPMAARYDYEGLHRLMD